MQLCPLENASVSPAAARSLSHTLQWHNNLLITWFYTLPWGWMALSWSSFRSGRSQEGWRVSETTALVSQSSWKCHRSSWRRLNIFTIYQQVDNRFGVFYIKFHSLVSDANSCTQRAEAKSLNYKFITTIFDADANEYLCCWCRMLWFKGKLWSKWKLSVWMCKTCHSCQLSKQTHL